MSSIIEFLTEIFRFFTDVFSRKREDRERLWDDILSVRKKIVLALEEGRVSDVPPLRRELDRLMRQYSKYVKSLSRRAGGGPPAAMSAVFAVLSVLVLSLSSGCLSRGTPEPSGTVFVLGERISVVEPGSVVEVPDLISPAKQWYLVDNVGLQYWLGIVVGPDSVEGAGGSSQ